MRDPSEESTRAPGPRGIPQRNGAQASTETPAAAVAGVEANPAAKSAQAAPGLPTRPRRARGRAIRGGIRLGPGRRSTRAAPALLAAIGLVAGCGAPPPTDAAPLVAVSILPQSWFVERIAGDRVRVAVMIPPGASPAFYEPTLEQVEAIAEATLYVAVGHLPFEAAWLDRLLAERSDLPVVSIPARGERATDPHLWVSPRHARAMARSIHGALTQQLPQQRGALDANLAGLLAEIDAVDDDCRRRLAPKRGGSFLVFHPAWGHFADEYGLVQIAIERDGKQPDARALAERIRGARAAGVRVVFAQPHFDPASAEIVAREIGARVEILDPLAYAWGDNLRHVANALAEAAVVE